MENNGDTVCSCCEEDNDSDSVPCLLPRKLDTYNDSSVCLDCEDDVEGERSAYTYPLFICFDGKTCVIDCCEKDEVSTLKNRVSEKIGLLHTEFYTP